MCALFLTWVSDMDEDMDEDMDGDNKRMQTMMMATNQNGDEDGGWLDSPGDEVSHKQRCQQEPHLDFTWRKI